MRMMLATKALETGQASALPYFIYGGPRRMGVKAYKIPNVKRSAEATMRLLEVCQDQTTGNGNAKSPIFSKELREAEA